jgi:hypothetical protein
MKSLYESILDDEDILIGNAKDDTKNPFILLRNLYDQYGDWKKVPIKKLKQVVKIFEGDYFTKFHLETQITHRGHLQIICDSIGREVLFTIHIPDDYIIKIIPTVAEKNINYLWGSLNKQQKYFKDIIKKYNMKYEKRLFELYDMYYIM